MAGKHLLVMDDEPSFAEFVRRVAEAPGFSVTAISNPWQFKRTYEAITPSVVVLDIVMPEIDGIELIQWIADQEHKAKIIVVSGWDASYVNSARTLAQIKGLDSIETLAKPISLSALRKALS
jgi:DNA-binding response OmpR family regulator